MARVFRGIVGADIVACFDEPDEGGNWNDINATRNGPMQNPGASLEAIHFHSRFNYHVALAGWPQSVTISHPAYAADAGTRFGILTVPVSHQSADYKIGDHNLGVVPPEWFVTADVGNGVNQDFPVGCPIQVGANGGGRRSISFWCDATSLYVHEDVKPGALGLPALSVTYYALVCRPTADEAGMALFSFAAASGLMQMGRGRIRSDERNLRDAQGGDANIFTLPTAPVGDLNNGKMRFVLLDMLTYDLGPNMGKHAYEGTFWGGAQKEVALSG